jgi:hypothetical protein
LGDYLLQAVQEPDSGDRASDRDRSSDARSGQDPRLCLEMICADFLAGANLDNGNPEILLSSMNRFFKFLPGKQRQQFLSCLEQKAS